jgi:hypothetical protein
MPLEKLDSLMHVQTPIKDTSESIPFSFGSSIAAQNRGCECAHPVSTLLHVPLPGFLMVGVLPKA